MAGSLEKWKVVSVIETMLLVDGESTAGRGAGSRELVKFMLELNGYRVLEAAHGIEALQVLEEWGGQIQLALCVEDLPDMTGHEWRMQARFFRPELPVLMLSERDVAEVSEMPVGSRHIGMPARPLAPQRLLERIRGALDEYFFARLERASAA